MLISRLEDSESNLIGWHLRNGGGRRREKEKAKAVKMAIVLQDVPKVHLNFQEAIVGRQMQLHSVTLCGFFFMGVH